MSDLQIKSVADVPRVQARLRPNAQALWHEGRVTTFREFDELSNRTANALIAAGVKPGDRIGVLAKGNDDFFILWMGAVKARACLNPVNWRLAPPEMAFILKDAGARMVIVGEDYDEVLTSILPQCGDVNRIIRFEPGHPRWPDFRSWIAGYPADDPMLPVSDDDDVIQLYTSGTTGLPKGVMLTERNYRALFDSASREWAKFEAGDSALVVMPLFHVAGANMGLLGLLQGASDVVMREVDPAKMLALIEQHRVRQCFMVPALINMLLQHPALPETDLSLLENVYYGASPISDEVLTRAQTAFGANFTQLYGATETIGMGTNLRPEAHKDRLLRSCGVASHGVEVRVMTEGRPAAPEEVGEIEIRSEGVMKGYWNRPDATAQAIDADGWYKTGDAGFFDEGGFLFIHDRVKDMIVSGGENVYPAEVENALFSHPDIADAAVIGVPDERWGEAVKAIVVLKPGAAADIASIIAHCRANIAAYKSPKSVDFTDTLPRNASGKVLRRELREPYWKGRERQVG